MAGRKRPIVSVDEQGEIVSYYESTSEAAKLLGMHLANLHRAVRKGTICKGRKWMYEAEYREYWMQGRTGELAYSEHEIRSQRAVRSWSRLSPERRKEMGRLISKGLRVSPKVRQFDGKSAWSVTSQPVMCVNTGERFDSIKKCAKGLGISAAGIQKALKEGHRIKGFVITHIK